MADQIDKAAEAAAREIGDKFQIALMQAKYTGIKFRVGHEWFRDIIARHMREAVGWVSVDERLPEDEQRKGGA